MRGRDRSTPGHLWVTAALVKTRTSSGVSRTEKPLDDPARVRISIRDDGPGVAESVRARLFDPFFTTKQPGEGTGLGLSVSFGIVAAHGGHLWYEPGSAGVGSTFIIELPVTARATDERQLTTPLHPAAQGIPQPARPQPKEAGAGLTTRRSAPRPITPLAVATPAVAPESPTPAAAPLRVMSAATSASIATPAPATASSAAAGGPSAGAPSGGTDTAPPPLRPRVLALDDEPSIRAFLRKALNAAGMDCFVFQDGAQALDGLRDIPFDVMLIDHRMAGMSGTEFYEAAVDFRPELTERAVFMSGDVLNPDLRGFATQRGIRLLAKPFDIDAVIRVVREVLAAAEEAEGTSAR
jgi:CheY-like chemotaxis protein